MRLSKGHMEGAMREEEVAAPSAQEGEEEHTTSDKGMSKKDRLRALLAQEILKDIDKYPRGYKPAARGAVSGRAFKLIDERAINSGVSRGSAAGNRMKPAPPPPQLTKMPGTVARRAVQSAFPNARARASALAGRGAGISVPAAVQRPSSAAVGAPRGSFVRSTMESRVGSRGASATPSRPPTRSAGSGQDTRFVNNRTTPFEEDRYLKRTNKVDEWGAIMRLDHLRHQEEEAYAKIVAKQQQEFTKRMLDMQLQERMSVKAAREDELARDKEYIRRSVIAVAQEDNERREARRLKAEGFFAAQMEQIARGKEVRAREAAEEYARGQEELQEAAEAIVREQERKEQIKAKEIQEAAISKAENEMQISRKKKVIEEEKLLDIELAKQYVAKLEAEEERRRQARAALEAKMVAIEGTGESLMARKLKLMRLREEKADRDHAELERRTAEAERLKVEAARRRELDNVTELKKMEEFAREKAQRERELELRQAEEVLRLAKEGMRLEQEQRDARRARAIEAGKNIQAQMEDDNVRKGYDGAFMTPREREINLGLLQTVKREVPKLWSQVDGEHAEHEAFVARHAELISQGRQF